MRKHFRAYICLFILFGFLFKCTIGLGQYDADKLDSYNDNIKTMAIMPFKLFVGRSGAKADSTPEMEKEATISKAYYLQRKTYEWFINNKRHCTITFQDIDKTDSLLTRTRLSYDALFGLNEGALCKYLGVDGIAYCEIRMSDPNFSTNLIFTDFSIPNYLINRKKYTNVTNYVMSIYDKSDEEVWKNTRTDPDDTNNSSDRLSKTFIRLISPKLPFMKH